MNEIAKDIEILKKAQSLFVSNETGVSLKGDFVSLVADLRIAHALKKVSIDQVVKTNFIIQDIWNICTIIHRLDWFREQAIKEKALDNMWLPYASVDIEHFHIEFRSVMNYAAEIISNASGKPGQIPVSFRKLFKWVKENSGNRKRIGEGLAVIVESASWFPAIRGVRDSLLHLGSFTLIFGSPKDGILFQVVMNGSTDLIYHKQLMLNNNVVYFERYAAIYLAYLFCFLESLSGVLYKALNIDRTGDNAKCSSPGFHIVSRWMEELINIIEKG
jgi:hypothetical protein